MKKTRLWILLLAVIALVVRGVQGTKDTLTGGLDSIKDGVEGVADGAGDLVEGAADAVADGAEAVVDGAGDLAEGAADAVADGADAVVDGAGDLVEGAGDAVADGAEAVVDAVDGDDMDMDDMDMDDMDMNDTDTVVDLEKSTVTREGRSGPKSHNGTVDIKSASISMTDGEISGGTVVIDMTTMVATDIDSDGLNDHLKAEDFFDVENHTTSSFTITSVDNNELTGDLMIKGTTLPVTVPVTMSDDGATATFSIDGTKWGVNDGGIKDALVSDTIDLEIFLAY